MSAPRTSIRWLAYAAVAAAASGCAVGPRYHAPAAPVGAGYAPDALADRSASAPVHGGAEQRLIAGRDLAFEWWRLFQSAPLDALIERALQANPTVTAAQAGLSQAREFVAAQRGFFYPTVGANFQAERHKVSGNTNSSQTVGVQGNGVNLLPQVPETPASINAKPRNLPSYYTFYTAQLSVGFVPDVLGGNRRQVESLAAQADVQRFALEATYVTLSANVAAAAIQQASLAAQIATTNRIIDVERQSLDILRAQFRLGFVMRSDVAAAEAALAQALATLPPLEKQQEQTRDLLAALVGATPDRAQERVDLDALQLPTELPLTLPAALLEHRPDIRSAEAQLRSANANVGVAVAAMLPEFSISGQYGGNATQVSQMFASGGPFWSLYGDVSQPVFQGGTLLHQKRAASAALRQAAAAYQGTVLTAYQNVADALRASLSDSETFKLDVDAENSAKLAYDLTRRQLETGYVTVLALLAAETTYQQALLTRIQAQATRYGDTVALFLALGGGWWNRGAADRPAARGEPAELATTSSPAVAAR
jgi:NodT family efflux transporter outer membrane factor (OMF) lipoprotein